MNHYHDPRDTNVFAEKRVHVNVSDRTRKRFFSKVHPGEGDACSEWRAGFSSDYGVFYSKELRGMGLAHRAAFAISRGYIPDGRLDVCHDCDNPKCVRFDHLFLGTRQDNMRDMVKKGRKAKDRPEFKSRGEMHYVAKLTEKQVHEIRRWFQKGGVACAEIGAKFGVTDGAISGVVLGKTWKHLKTEGWEPAKTATVTRKFSKLTEKDIPRIRHLRSLGKSFSQIGKVFGVSHITIFQACHYQTWAHVKGDVSDNPDDY